MPLQPAYALIEKPQSEPELDSNHREDFLSNTLLIRRTNHAVYRKNINNSKKIHELFDSSEIIRTLIFLPKKKIH